MALTKGIREPMRLLRKRFPDAARGIGKHKRNTPVECGQKYGNLAYGENFCSRLS